MKGGRVADFDDAAAGQRTSRIDGNDGNVFVFGLRRQSWRPFSRAAIAFDDAAAGRRTSRIDGNDSICFR